MYKQFIKKRINIDIVIEFVQGSDQGIFIIRRDAMNFALLI